MDANLPSQGIWAQKLASGLQPIKKIYFINRLQHYNMQLLPQSTLLSRQHS